MTQDRPTIYLDIDGCLNPVPFHPDSSSDWQFGPEFGHLGVDLDTLEPKCFLLNLSQEMARALEALECTIKWLTTWVKYDDKTAPIRRALGWDRMDSLDDLSHVVRRSDDNRWKLNSIRQVLAQPGAPVVWIDDELDRFLDGCVREELDPHHRLITLCPDLHVGITREALEVIKARLAARRFAAELRGRA